MLISNNSPTKLVDHRKIHKSPLVVNPQREKRQLLAAINDGWQILEAANYLAHGVNSEGSGYLLTLFHPRRLQTIEYNISRSAGIDAILAFEAVPGYTG